MEEDSNSFNQVVKKYSGCQQTYLNEYEIRSKVENVKYYVVLRLTVADSY